MPNLPETKPYRLPQCRHCTTPPELVYLEPAKVARWHAGEHVQQVWPELPAADRELLLTGTHDACWQAMFPKDGE